MRTRWMDTLAVVLTLAILTGAMAGCGATRGTEPAEPAAEESKEAPTEVPTEPTEAEGPKRGGSLTWARQQIAMTLDPVWTDANSDIWLMVNIYEPLVRINDDGTNLEPALAESWDIGEDGLVYTFHLRPGVKFHNGDPLTASDVVWSLERARDPDAGIWNWSLSNVDTIEALDESTVEITLKERSAQFLAMIALFSNNILPQQPFEEMGEEEFFKKPIGTGPFAVEEYRPSEHLILAKNPYYWELGEDGKPLPYLDEVVVNQVPEDTTRSLQVQGGEIDGTDGIPFSQVEELEQADGVNMELFSSTQSYYVLLNHRREPLGDPNIRRAMNYAVDQQALIDAVCFGYCETATSFRPRAGTCWNENLDGFPYDLAEAKQYMAESDHPDGFEGLTIMVPSGSGIGLDIAELAKAMWQDIGIEVDIEEVEGGQMAERYYANDFDMISGYQWTDDVLDPHQQHAYFVVDPAYHTGWENERAIEAVQEAGTLLELEERCELYKESQALWNEESASILTFHTPFRVLTRDDVKGFNQIPLGWLVWKETWLDR